MATVNQTLTEVQYARAYALARAYGHEWGCPHYADAIDGLRDPQAIGAAVLAASEGASWIGNVQIAPILNEFGSVTHTTGSGRTSWVIEPDGFVEIVISRPSDGEIAQGRGVLGVSVFPTGRIEARAYDDRYYARHVDALLGAIIAVREGDLLPGAQYDVPLQEQCAFVLTAAGVVHNRPEPVTAAWLERLAHSYDAQLVRWADTGELGLWYQSDYTPRQYTVVLTREVAFPREPATEPHSD